MAKEERAKYGYQYDSVARAYAQPAEPIKVPTPGEPKRKSKSAPRPKLDVAFGAQLTICGVVLFTCSIFYVHSYASLRTKQLELNTIKAEKISVMDEITDVEARITKKMDLDQIRERAMNELGMQKPLPNQIIYLELQEESYTTYQD